MEDFEIKKQMPLKCLHLCILCVSTKHFQYLYKKKHFHNREKEQITPLREFPLRIYFTWLPSEYKKLASLLPRLRVGEFNCASADAGSICRDLFINKFPTFVVFKVGGGYEIRKEQLRNFKTLNKRYSVFTKNQMRHFTYSAVFYHFIAVPI